jgi:hypothetical protein
VLAGEHHHQLALADEVIQLVEGGAELAVDLLALFGQLDQGARVLGGAEERLGAADVLAVSGALALDFLGAFLVVPEAGLADQLVKLGDFRAAAVEVKDSSVVYRSAPSVRTIFPAALPSSAQSLFCVAKRLSVSVISQYSASRGEIGR